MSLQPRVVLVYRDAEYVQLLERHGTRQQAEFFLRSRGQELAPIAERHERFRAARGEVLSQLPVAWRRTEVHRDDLDRFLFAPDDVVVALGQDGLVANLAKYLEGQPVVGLNPDPERYEGVLVPHAPGRAGELLLAAIEGRGRYQLRSMVQVTLDDGQRLRALNELYLGHQTHQSSRYELATARGREAHSSSGVIVSTGTGATGWTRSIHRQRRTELELPAPEDDALVFFVREAWPSVATGTALTEGALGPGDALTITSRMNDRGVVFGDGIEDDRLEFTWGRIATVELAPVKLKLLLAAEGRGSAE
ncbi:MAG: hypothetical protein KDD82_11950 [Planctomycetes bacterium]|nr:hypothetical protein [Planctomycetota bacterium]